MAEIESGVTLYDMNKQVIAQNCKPITDTVELNSVLVESLKKYYAEFPNNEYYMLLCREENDYTILHHHAMATEKKPLRASAELAECLQNRGEVFSVENVDGAIEIWIALEDDGETSLMDRLRCYYYFVCDQCIVEVGG